MHHCVLPPVPVTELSLSLFHTPSLRTTKQVSNFDERLHPLLKNLGVYDEFDFVLTSRYKSVLALVRLDRSLSTRLLLSRFIICVSVFASFRGVSLFLLLSIFGL